MVPRLQHRRLPNESLKFLKGEDKLSEFKGAFGIRAFCANCGSKLMNYAPDKNVYLSVALACIDSNVEEGPAAHAFADSKATWHEPSSDIPAFPEIPHGAFE